VVVLCTSLYAGSTPAGTQPQGKTESQGQVVEKKAYTLNTDIAVTLAPGQAVQLDVAANPYGLQKYIISYLGSGPEGTIRLDTCLADGTTSGGGSEVGPTGRGSKTRGLAGTPCRAYLEWQVDQGKAVVNLLVALDAGQPKPLPEVERIAGFVRLWSEVKYNFAFFSHVPELDWDTVLVEYLPRVQAAGTDVQYYRVLRRCMALLRDGHTDLWGPSDTFGGRLPFALERVENMAVLTAVCDPNTVTRAGQREQLFQAHLQRGEALTHIDGRRVEDILEQDIYPYVCASTPQGRDLRAYPQLLAGPFGRETTVRLRTLEGSERQVRLTWGRYQIAYPGRDLPDLQDLPGGIVYFKAASFGTDDVVKRFDAALDRICSARGLILDLRPNGGGNTGVGYALLSRMTDKTLPGAKWKTRKYVPAYRAWRRPEQWEVGDHGVIQPRVGPRYLGPVAVMVGPSTCSAAEDFVTVFQCAGRGQVIGQPTNGSTGQPLTLDLPGGGGARICTKWDTYPDGREFVGIGCVPDIEVRPTRAEIAAGRDVTLEKAVTLLRE